MTNYPIEVRIFMNINSGKIIGDIMELNKRQFIIPVYQRNYEWTERQCDKLFSDIMLAYKKDKPHFCGSIVYAFLKEEKNISHYVIIDGQQRMTTLYLLLKALIDEAENQGTVDEIRECLLNRDHAEKFTTDIASKIKLILYS